ncbi:MULTISPECIES: YitT family protein [Bifidobacterium]|uniref:Putative integral membrane protein n=1 Tax=Bifidobacterium pullorum TaxID=78448 RepID=A0A7V8HQN5_9BIFI|nr:MULTISPECIES: DUF6198 family protein [Bifidobacterium]KFI83181.1 putative integral membrane protein [Bifidobacterium pullorum]MBS5402014.1 YitT family protein [Bifidobacterium sp.]
MRAGSFGSHLGQRYAWFALGVCANAFAIALIAHSGLGVGAISSVSYVLAAASGLSFGTLTFVVNALFIVGEIALLRRDFHPIQVLQLPTNMVFSAMIDVSSAALDILPADTWPARIAAFAAGCVLLALGVAIEVAPNVILIPGEGIERAINVVSGKPFGTCKATFETALALSAIALSLLLLGRIEGVGVGTVISAVCVGRIVNVLNLRLPLLRHIALLAQDSVGM